MTLLYQHFAEAVDEIGDGVIFVFDLLHGLVWYLHLFWLSKNWLKFTQHLGHEHQLVEMEI